MRYAAVTIAGVDLVDTNGLGVRATIEGLGDLGVPHRMRQTVMADGSTRERFLLNVGMAGRPLTISLYALPVTVLHAMEAAVSAAMAAFGPIRVQLTYESRVLDLACSYEGTTTDQDETDGRVQGVKISLKIKGVWS